ncbi:MAG TPA: CAP domain-containing protein [Rhizomicrobium sp.]|nr:CAP domain-containing protein [Rhizomicrobium sp.]
MLRASAVCVAVLLLTACTTTQVAVRTPPPDPKTVMPALENRIYELVSEERHKIDPNAKDLSLDSELVGVARSKSADMAEHNYIAHAAPDGQTSASIIMDKDASFQGLLGENIGAEHYWKDYGVDVEEMAHRFVDLWLASKTHRDNLSLAAYDRTGVGAAVNGDTVYVTELFATNLGLPPAPANAGGAPAPAK